jgi:hypothetical protein
MPEYSRHQKKIIDGYYAHRDQIMLNKLQELVTELYLAEDQRKQDQLWTRVATAMKNLKIKPGIATHILERRDPAVLAKNVQDWLKGNA